MKPLNNKEIRSKWIKFISMYCVTILLIVIVMCSFLNIKPVIKTVTVQNVNPVKRNAASNTKTVVVTDKMAIADSIKNLQLAYNKKIEMLEVSVSSQNNTIFKLQNQLKQVQKNKAPGTSYGAEVTKLNRHIEFLDWALRSQVAETNTLTKENAILKANIEKLKATGSSGN